MVSDWRRDGGGGGDGGGGDGGGATAPIALHTRLCTLFTPREFFLRAGFRMLLLALAGVANEQQKIAALQEQVAAQQAQMAALQAQVAALVQNAATT